MQGRGIKPEKRDIYTLSRRQLTHQKIEHLSDESQEDDQNEEVQDGESGTDMMFTRNTRRNTQDTKKRLEIPIQASCGESNMLYDYSDSNNSHV